MLLLGNDFLEAHAACIELSPDARHDGRLTLVVNNRRVPSLVSTRPRLSSLLCTSALLVAGRRDL